MKPPLRLPWTYEAEAGPNTVGIEEEVMLLSPRTWALANRIETIIPRLPEALASQMTAETHGSAIELKSTVHRNATGAVAELRELRQALIRLIEPLDLRAAAAGTHPFAVWQEIVVSEGDRYEFVHGSMRALARREPTFALHVHVGVADPETAIRVYNRMRAHLPLLLALSANSPYWQGRDTGLASARTPLFQAFPRVGIPRPFHNYRQYEEQVEILVDTEAIPDGSFLWWDIRPQPDIGTLEIRTMDAQTTPEDTAALVALTQTLVALETHEGYVSAETVDAQEVISENRFIAARDGARAELVDVDRRRRVPVRGIVEELLPRCRPYAEDLGCADELDDITRLLEHPPAERQKEKAGQAINLAGLVKDLASRFSG